MEKEINIKEKNSPIAIPLAAIAGCSFAGGAIFMKVATGSIGELSVVNSAQWVSLFTNIYFWISIFFNIAGLVMWFWALTEGRVAILGPFMSGFLMLIPAIVGITIMKEPISILKILGISFVVIGALGLSGRE